MNQILHAPFQFNTGAFGHRKCVRNLLLERLSANTLPATLFVQLFRLCC
jgi:hypothetical protein